MPRWLDLHCPYCGEPIEAVVDESAGDQDYVEDCQVCCRPIAMRVRLDDEGEPWLRARREDEA
ncbi:CPXCG motif-containing cysteine-rich protein [Pseudoxanthomonas sp. Soil82]|uniref:CPXCG motif-containing cysteine-rich protein n=1 Tax=Pseudoxanthomonas sp. Soil82 TaxID=3157341 RepID=UPI00338E6F59